MEKENKDGLVLEYLQDLVFYDENFTYGKDCNYFYQDILSITYNATAIKKSINLIPAGTSYETFLSLHLSDGFILRIEQEKSFFGFKEKEKAEAVMRASSIFHELTFTLRMERYEKRLEEKGFVSWGNYQLNKKGDLFKNNELLFNLKDPNINTGLHVFTFIAEKKASNFKESLIKLWKSAENINISTDRDCFLYFMKNYLGYSWKSETVKQKKKSNRHDFYEAVLILGAKLCKADGKIDSEEIRTFKRYFGIDENSFPGSADIFTKAANSLGDIKEPANKIYNLFEGQTEPLEHIIIGLLQIAAADGEITDTEKKIIEDTCVAFKFPNEEIERLFLIFENIKGKKDFSKGEYVNDVRSKHLKILGLKFDASDDAIKIAYKELVRKHHPDALLAKGLPIERIKDSEEMLKAINVAYNWLVNEANKKKAAAA